MNPSFAQFVEATAPSLLRYFRTHIGNGADAEDLAQTAYLSLFSRPKFNPGHPAAIGFLYRKARWLVRDHLRARRFPLALPIDLLDPDCCETVLALEKDELGACVQRAVAALPVSGREIVLLHLQGKSHPEIAAALGLSIGAVYSRFHQAKADLRCTLRDVNSGHKSNC